MTQSSTDAIDDVLRAMQARACAIQHPDCCAGLSLQLVDVLGKCLPPAPATVLSIGAGSGLLEAIVLNDTHASVNLYGVEVPSCHNKYLRSGRMLRVANTASLHPEAKLAEALVFVYPRSADLVASYLHFGMSGALQQMLYIGHRSDWAEEYEALCRAVFSQVHTVADSGLPVYEVLAIATAPIAATATPSCPTEN